MVDEQVEPCLRNRLLLKLMLNTIDINPSAETGNGQDASQLHNPPDEHLYAE